MRVIKHKALFFSLFATAIALPASAAAPPFDTPAPVAFMKDLSSGAILYAKDADRRMPPASMAKMMTTHIAFNLIRQGKLKEEQMCQVRPETWKFARPRMPSALFVAESFAPLAMIAVSGMASIRPAPNVGVGILKMTLCFASSAS